MQSERDSVVEIKKQRDQIRIENFKKNIEREKRKMEFKKLNVLAKDKLVEDKIKAKQQDEEFISKAKVYASLIFTLSAESLLCCGSWTRSACSTRSARYRRARSS